MWAFWILLEVCKYLAVGLLGKSVFIENLKIPSIGITPFLILQAMCACLFLHSLTKLAYGNWHLGALEICISVTTKEIELLLICLSIVCIYFFTYCPTLCQFSNGCFSRSFVGVLSVLILTSAMLQIIFLQCVIGLLTLLMGCWQQHL